MNLGERLKEERERLGMSQPAFAEIAGAKKHAQINWEKGIAAPNGAALEAWAKIGVDVLYVITGQRSLPVESALKPDEAALLDNYRHLSKEQQDILKATSAAFAQSKLKGKQAL